MTPSSQPAGRPSASSTMSPTEPPMSARPSPETTPPDLALMLRIIAVSSILLTVVVGGALFFFPALSQPRWLWPLKPFNTRFLGAIYLTAAVGFISLLSAKRAALVRLIVPMLCVFTVNALMVSCLQLQQFTVERRATDIWFWLYIVDGVGAAYYWGYYKQYIPAGRRQLPRWLSVGLWGQAGLLGVYGLGLLFFPVSAGSGWLWPLDVFHSQLYSSLFLAGAVGSGLMARRATAVELRSLGAIQLTFSVLSLLGIWLVDKEIRRIDWSGITHWGWIGAIALLGIAGITLIQQSKHLERR